jgi:hypothetical protein
LALIKKLIQVKNLLKKINHYNIILHTKYKKYNINILYTNNMTTYAYVSGTAGSNATITFNGPLGAPIAYNNLGSGPGTYKTIGFTYTSSIVSTVNFNIIPSKGDIDGLLYYISKCS